MDGRKASLPPRLVASPQTATEALARDACSRFLLHCSAGPRTRHCSIPTVLSCGAAHVRSDPFRSTTNELYVPASAEVLKPPAVYLELWKSHPVVRRRPVP